VHLTGRRGRFLLAAAAAAILVAPGLGRSTATRSEVITFSGKGSKVLRSFKLGADSTLSWHATGRFFGTTSRARGRSIYGTLVSTAHAGTSFLPRGYYALNVVARGAWTISVRPGAQPWRRSGKASLFSGNGRLALPPLRVRRDSILQWRQHSGHLFQIVNTTAAAGAVQARENSGNSYLPPGSYRFVVLAADGNWSLSVVPER
jgi:hypothetical protein